MPCLCRTQPLLAMDADLQSSTSGDPFASTDSECEQHGFSSQVKALSRKSPNTAGHYVAHPSISQQRQPTPKATENRRASRNATNNSQAQKSTTPHSPVSQRITKNHRVPSENLMIQSQATASASNQNRTPAKNIADGQIVQFNSKEPQSVVTTTREPQPAPVNHTDRQSAPLSSLTYNRSLAATSYLSSVTLARLQKAERNRTILQAFKDDSSLKLKEASLKFGISEGHASQMRKLLKKCEMSVDTALGQTSPYKGRPPVLKMDSEILLLNQLEHCITMDVAVSEDDLADAMLEMAVRQDENIKLPENYPSKHVIERYLSAYGLQLRKGKLLSTNFSRGERIEKLADYASVWLKLFEEQPMCRNSIRIFNLDETLIDFSIGQTSRFVAKKGAKGGVTRARFSERRFTLALITRADGDILPPICVVPRKTLDPSWSALVDGSRMTIVAHETTCTTAELLITYVEHLNTHARASLRDKDPIVLVLDGHSSRDCKDRRWLERAESFNIYVIVSPSCTSHFLQPNDQKVNRMYKQTIRKVKDMLDDTPAFSDLSEIEKKLKVCMLVHQTIRSRDVLESWENTLLLPLQFETFVERWCDRNKKFDIQFNNLMKRNIIKGSTKETERRVLVQLSQNHEEDEKEGPLNLSSQVTPSINTASLTNVSGSNKALLMELYASMKDVFEKPEALIDDKSEAFRSVMQLATTVGFHVSTGVSRSLGTPARKRMREAALRPGQHLPGGARQMKLTDYLRDDAERGRLWTPSASTRRSSKQPRLTILPPVMAVGPAKAVVEETESDHGSVEATSQEFFASSDDEF